MSHREYHPFVDALPRASGQQSNEHPVVIVGTESWEGRVHPSHGDALFHDNKDSGIHLTVRRTYYESDGLFRWDLWKMLDEGIYLRSHGWAPTVEGACQAALEARIETRLVGDTTWHTVDHSQWKASMGGHEASVAHLDPTFEPTVPFQWERAHPAFDGVLGDSLALPLLKGRTATLAEAFAACERAPTLAYLKLATFVVEHPELGRVQLPAQEQAA